jgi:hypothetical protein
MDQIILLAGTVFASSIGLALLALVLITTIRRSHEQAGSALVQTLHLVDEENFLASAVSEPAIRGYDTPELCQEDNLARYRQSTDEKHLH